MRKVFWVLSLVLFISSCSSEKKSLLKEGTWLGELAVTENDTLPFNFKVFKSGAAYTVEIYNASEVIQVDEIEIKNDSIVIKIPVFESYISGTFTENHISGEFIIASLERIVPFEASFGVTDRFKVKPPSQEDITGIWETEFEHNMEGAFPGKGVFEQKGNKVTGTFRTNTGDYRYLEGVRTADSVKLSAFDGSHAFLFTAKVTDSTLNGTFFSGNHYKVPFVSKRNPDFELPSPDSLTFLKEGYDSLEFSFPNAEGETISLTDETFKNKVVILQLMGTWCPNCLDETKFLLNYLKENPNNAIEIVALAFEYAKTEEAAFKSISRMKERLKVAYPVLLAQYGSYDKELAQQKLPALNHVLSYPTAIFIDKKGKVRKIHTGFNGPVTGDKFIEFKKEFEAFVDELNAE